nr:hypothetical protein [Streptomyces microflavus]
MAELRKELLDEAACAGTLADGVSHEDATAATVAVTTGFEVLGRYDSEWLSARTLTGFWRLLLPRLATQETLPLLDPSGPPRRRRPSPREGRTWNVRGGVAAPG